MQNSPNHFAIAPVQKQMPKYNFHETVGRLAKSAKVDFTDGADVKKLQAAQLKINQLEAQLTEISSPDAYEAYRTAICSRLAKGETVELQNSFDWSQANFEKKKVINALQSEATAEVAEDIKTILANFADYAIDLSEKTASSERNAHIFLGIEHQPSEALRVLNQISSAVRNRSKDETFQSPALALRGILDLQ